MPRVRLVPSKSRRNLNGQCVPVMQTLINPVVEFKLKLTYKFAERLDDSAVFTDAYELISLGNPFRKDVIVCWQDIKTNVDNASVYHATYVLNVLGEIQPEKYFIDLVSMIKHFNKLENSTHYVQLSQAPVKDQAYNTVRYYSFEEEPASCMQPIAMTKIQFCETLGFSSNNFYVSQANGSVIIEGQEFKKGTYVFRTSDNSQTRDVHVCMDEYLENHQAINSVLTNHGERCRFLSLCLIVCLGFRTLTRV